MQIYFPYQITRGGTTATTTDAKHVAELLEQVLFTNPGERVNRPAFGAGLSQLVFAPASDELASTVELFVRGAILQWLPDVVRAETVSVEANDATITVRVTYVILPSQERVTSTFEREVLSL